MKNKVEIGDRLLKLARLVGLHKSDSEAIAAALRESIGIRKQRRILSLFGTIDFDPEYDYKRERRKKRCVGMTRPKR